jgi:hypothetical protein
MPIPRSSFLPHHSLHMYDMGSPTGLAKAVAAFCGGSNSTGRKKLTDGWLSTIFGSIWSTNVALALLKRS